MIQNVITGQEDLNSNLKNTKVVSPKVAALRVKIHDADYLNYAIGRIAQVLSRELLDAKE